MEVKEEENQPPKRVKTHEPLDPEDRLIIDEILSRLPFTKYAIRTGTLSKRWQHLWLSVPCLSFADHHLKEFLHSDYIHLFVSNRQLSDFYLYVNETLTQCPHPQFKNLNKFHVRVTYENRFESHVDNWIHFATSSNVQKLDLFLDTGDDVALFVLEDDSLFINSHFTHLVLKGCILYPTGRIAWNNLTHLTIINGKLDQDLIANILSGCPLLDTLKLADCYGYSRLNITSKSVKNLEFNGYSCQEDENPDDIIHINAPYITSLSIKGTLWLWKILLRDVSSLVKAELDYIKLGYKETTLKEEKEEMLIRFILRLHHVKELKIGKWCYTTFRRLEAKGLIFPSNVKLVQANSDDSMLDHHLKEYLHSDYIHLFVSNRQLSDFYPCVDETLTQCHHPQFKNLNKFRVRLTYENRFESHVDNWIHFATSSNVQKLDFFLDTGDDVALFVLEDDSFFINSHFSHLVLKGCILYPTGRIAWNNLTHLTIINGKLDQDLFANIQSGCPLLDTLKLADCYGYSRLDITSKSVKNLEFNGYSCQEDENLDHIIHINAPYITSLSIKGFLLLWKILLRDLSSLVKAELDYIKMGHKETTLEEKEVMLIRFILRLHYVKELKIGKWCYTTFRRLEAKGLIFLSKVKLVQDNRNDSMLSDFFDNVSSVGGS